MCLDNTLRVDPSTLGRDDLYSTYVERKAFVNSVRTEGTNLKSESLLAFFRLSVLPNSAAPSLTFQNANNLAPTKGYSGQFTISIQLINPFLYSAVGQISLLVLGTF